MTLRTDYGLRMQRLFSAHASPDVGHERDTSVAAISWLIAVDSTAVVARAVHHAIRLMSCGITTPLRIGCQCRRSLERISGDGTADARLGADAC